MPDLQLSPKFSLKLSMTTLTQAILASRGAGKTNTAVVYVEEAMKSSVPCWIIDPVGSWWGLKSSANGKSAGYPVVIFGGEHGDVPLEADAGEIVAQALVEGRFSAIIDLSLFRKAAIQRFMAPFLETLYRLNRDAVHLVVDEADVVAPQKPFGEEARTLGAMQDVVRRGRARGLGVTLISQRAAVLNKDVLSQANVLWNLRMSHNRDIAATKEWIAAHGSEDLAKQMLASLPSLPTGTAWVWAPEFGIFEKVAIRKRETFDSSRTPQPGEVMRQPKVLAPVDIKALGAQIAATVEKAKADSPVELKRRIAELERKQAAPTPKSAPSAEAIGKAVDAAVRAEAARWQARDRKVMHDIGQLGSVLEAVNGYYDLAKTGLSADMGAPLVTTPLFGPPSAEPPRTAAGYEHVARVKAAAESNGNGELNGTARKLLDSLARLKAIGVTAPSRTLAGHFAGYSNMTGGNVTGAIGALNKLGLVNAMLGCLSLTAEGDKVAPPVAAPPTLAEYHATLQGMLNGTEWKLLQVLIESYPKQMGRAELGEMAGYSNMTGGNVTGAIGRLTAMGLMESPERGQFRGTKMLFLEGQG